MSDKILKIKNILNFNTYYKNETLYNHLFEVQQPPENINLWKIRFNFGLGTPLVGDLVLDLEKESNLEIHPFPEWVVYLKSFENKSSKPYLIVLNLSKSFMKRISRKSIDVKIDLIQKEVDNATIDNLLAFQYDIGVNVLIPAFIPHFFIASRIKKSEGEQPPYLQVFEPNIEAVTKNLNVKMTHFFKLPFLVSI